MTTITLTLGLEETNQLLGLLGDQPIKSNLAGLTAKIKAQGDSQLVQAAASADDGGADGAAGD
jgi:hypothetical protein